MICGDFNARTGNVNDFISISDKHCPDNSITTQIDTSRQNIDPELNSHGQKLIQLCKENNLRIGNGRCSGDSFGKCTFFSVQGHKNLVDYTLVSDPFFNNIGSLFVRPLSDHCQVVTSIKILKKNGEMHSKSNYTWKNLPKYFKSDSHCSPIDYSNALNTPHINFKTENFLLSSFFVSKEGTEQANKTLTDIMCEAAKLSLPLKGIRKFKTHKPKKWFNKECKRARTLYKQAANKVNNNPLEQQFLEEKIIRLKEF